MNSESVRRSGNRVRPWQGVIVLASLAIVLQVGLLTAVLGIQPVVLGGTAVATAVYGGIVAYGSHRHGTGPAGPTPATALTILRGTPVVVLAGLLPVGRQAGMLGWLPALLFGTAALLDAADGRIARATDSVSPLGDWLDTEVDAFAVLVAVVWAVQVGAVPAVFLIAGVARYLYTGALLVRRWRGRETAPLDEVSFRRVNGAVQMGVLFVLLAPVLPRVGTGIALVWLVPVIGMFLRDWLVATRRLVPVGT